MPPTSVFLILHFLFLLVALHYFRKIYSDFFSLQALDKIRFESLTDKSKLDAQPELFIRLVPDKANKTLSIIDSGIGMTKAGKLIKTPFSYINLKH